MRRRREQSSSTRKLIAACQQLLAHLNQPLPLLFITDYGCLLCGRRRSYINVRVAPLIGSERHAQESLLARQ
jgi:hypothetical protein